MARGKISDKKPEQSTKRSGKGKREIPRADPTALFSIKSFCLAHQISEGFYFQLRDGGLGPDELRLGTRVFITFESAARWRAEREAATAAAPKAVTEAAE